MISKRIKDVLANEIRSKKEVEEIVSHLVSKHIWTGEMELSCAVKLLLQQCYSPAGIKRKHIARQLCTSERNLTRKLKREGVSYRQLVDEFRKERCIALMQQGVTAATELTRQLCFSDSAYVYRAFRRWTGVSFSEAKQMLAQNPSVFVSVFHSERELSGDNLNSASISMHSKADSGGNVMRELTVHETEEVGGAVAPIVALFAARAAVGGFSVGAGYLGGAATRGQYSRLKFAGAVNGGAVGGAFGGVPAAGAAGYFRPRAILCTFAAFLSATAK